MPAKRSTVPSPADAVAEPSAAAPVTRGIRPKLTLNDVAQALGVSRATVSNAFNRPDQLSAARREEILAKARELGYFGPDPAARALRMQSRREVAVMFHHGLGFALGDSLSIDFLRGVGQALDARGLSLQLIPKLGRDLELASAFRTTADALIVYSEIGPELVAEAQSGHKPMVLVDTSVPGVPSVRIADRQGAEQAMDHVLAARPDRVVIIAFTLNDQQRASVFHDPAPAVSASVAVERGCGYIAAARRSGWPLDRIDWIAIDDQHPEVAVQSLSELRAKLPKGTRLGLLGMTDRMALAARETLRRWRGVELVAVVGFDDIPEAAEAGLTTIRQDAVRKGELAVQVVLDQLPSQLLDVNLVVRKT